jgi:hypothetical protein
MERMASIPWGLPGIKDRDSSINGATVEGLYKVAFQEGILKWECALWAQKEKPILKRVKDGKKIAMKKKINIGVPISSQIYIFYFKAKGIIVRRTYP